MQTPGRAPAATLVCTCFLSSAVALEMASDFNSTSQSGQGGDADGDTIRNAVVASVVGVGCVVTLCLLVIFAVLHCHFKKDKVGDVDGMKYVYQDEYEAWINYDVLDSLDPSIRDKIDFDFLAQLTNTDPALLEKYKVQTQQLDTTSEGGCGQDMLSQSCGSLHTLPPLSPAQSSLKGVQSLRRSSTVKNHSLTTSSGNSPAIKRVSTFTNINDLLNRSLNMSHASLVQQSRDKGLHYTYRGSQPTVQEGHKTEDMAKHLLQLLAAVKMADHRGEQDLNPVTKV